MKSKNIFLTIAFSLLVFGACTEEEIIDAPDVQGKGDLVLELSSSSIQTDDITKAASKDESLAPIDNEKNVKDVYVFVFDQSGKIVGSPNYFNFGSTKANGTSSANKTVVIEALDFGRYDFWAVANPTKDDYTNCKNLTSLQKIIEGVESYNEAFSADALVKVGSKTNVDFKGGANSVQIKMTQLSARVEVAFKLGLEGNAQLSVIPTVSNIRTQAWITDPMKVDGCSENGKYQGSSLTLDKEGTQNIVFYTYGKTKDNHLNVSLAGNIGKDTYSSSFNINVPDNITKGCIQNGHSYKVTAVIKSIPVTGKLDVEIESFEEKSVDFSFN
ncbi:FimB/Mfa2 family fimbrial subunit [Parabacteroides chongii]|uniref:FimB/Mfa2 family fimbrial subunit n=1 Tax=Parabacteroides chongii TaxID=2685834 RepID=UPI00240D388F|nr:FimB/Mfa2 family fimbrial subunit [Parabacteroides chongii]WFE86726.1 FimB/Mfa2 family fimbrial subunit [Parabacteroides chongii]